MDLLEKKFICPLGKLRTEFTSPTAKYTSPGYQRVKFSSTVGKILPVFWRFWLVVWLRFEPPIAGLTDKVSFLESLDN